MRQFYYMYLSPLALIVISILLWFETNRLPKPMYEPLGSAFMPRLCLTIIITLCIILIIKGIFSQHAGKIEQTKYPEIKKEGYINIFVFLASLCAYIILISYTDIPYLALTFIYLFSFGFFLAEYDKKSIIPLFASSSIITVIIYVLFSFFLEVIFP